MHAILETVGTNSKETVLKRLQEINPDRANPDELVEGVVIASQLLRQYKAFEMDYPQWIFDKMGACIRVLRLQRFTRMREQLENLQRGLSQTSEEQEHELYKARIERLEQQMKASQKEIESKDWMCEFAQG